MTMTYVEIGVTDLDRSGEFYTGLLGFTESGAGTEDGRNIAWLGDGPGRIKLVELPAGRPSVWDRDDKQCGIRHFGLKVAEIDEWASKLGSAGVRFENQPFDAFGDVRICFFYDPDGAYLEFVQGYVQHNNLWSAALAQEEIDGDEGWDGTPRFDHVAVTVPDLASAQTYYADGLGFGRIGQLVRDDDEQGFLITNLRAGPGTLEVFTFGVPTHRRDDTDPSDHLGLRAVGVRHQTRTGDEAGPGDVPLRLEP